MSEIRLVRLPSANILNNATIYYAVHLNDATAIFNGSLGLTENDCETLANSWIFARCENYRFYLIASKVGAKGSIRTNTRAYRGYDSIDYDKLKPMFCTECGALLEIGQRHNCNAPRCSECGDFLGAVDIKKGHSMCPKCRAKFVARIFEYHGWCEDPIFQKPLKRETVLHMGTEWETQFSGGYDEKCIATENVSAVANPDPWKHNLRFMRDGTISGVEMITEPKTLRGYIESEELKNAIETAKSNGFFVDDHNGAHIHLDRAFFGNRSEICGAMMCYLVAVYWDAFWKPLSRRNTFNWCHQPRAEKEDNVIKVYEKNSKVSEGSDHSVAVNCGNRNTIELRFWSGTLDWDEIIARFDISRALAIWAKKNPSDNLMAYKVSDIFKYIERKETFNYIRQYVTNAEILAEIPD